jgi:hypothetical protein
MRIALTDSVWMGYAAIFKDQIAKPMKRAPRMRRAATAADVCTTNALRILV